MNRTILVAAIASLLLGCSDRQIYDSMQGARESECREIPDAREQDRCFEAARETWDVYEQRRRESRSTPETEPAQPSTEG